MHRLTMESMRKEIGKQDASIVKVEMTDEECEEWGMQVDRVRIEIIERLYDSSCGATIFQLLYGRD